MSDTPATLTDHAWSALIYAILGAALGWVWGWIPW